MKLSGHDSRPGFEICGVSIAGRVEIVRGAEAQPFVERVHRRYVEGTSEALPPVREFLASDDVALCLVPEAALIWDERAAAKPQRRCAEPEARCHSSRRHRVPALTRSSELLG